MGETSKQHFRGTASWVDSETEDTVVRRRFPNIVQIVGSPQLPFGFVDFERVLQVFVGKHKM
jgi:hypothetical protein